MSSTTPSFWIEMRGRQHRSHLRNRTIGLPDRFHEPLETRADAEDFAHLAAKLGLDTAREALCAADEEMVGRTACPPSGEPSVI